MTSLGAGSDKGETGWHLPLRLYRLSVAFGLPSSWSGLALFLCSLVLSFLVFVLSFLRLVRFAFVIFVLSWSRLVFLASRLVLSCCVSCLVFVLFCLVLPLSLSLFCLICVVLSSCCVALCVCRLGSLCRLIFGRFGSSRVSMLAILGRLGGLLGAFWGLFWPSWAVLGGLGVILRP